MTLQNATEAKSQWNDLTPAEWYFMVHAQKPIIKCQKCGRPGTQLIQYVRDRPGGPLKATLRITHASPHGNRRTSCYMGRPKSEERLLEEKERVRKPRTTAEYKRVLEEITAAVEPSARSEMEDKISEVRGILRRFGFHKEPLEGFRDPPKEEQDRYNEGRLFKKEVAKEV